MTRVLIIAGTDSSGGAGLTRDTATATTLGCTVAPVVTAVTVQTHRQLHDITPIPPEVISAQIRAAAESERISAVKLGMIGSAQAAQEIADALGRFCPDTPVVFDPVLRSSSGGVLMKDEALMPLLEMTTLLTPNLAEAAHLSGRAESSRPVDLARQGERLQRLGAQAVLIKGGHGSGGTSVDHLFADGHMTRFERPRLPQGRRGTGCTLATALACALGAGASLAEACQQAGDHVHKWIKSAVAA